MLLFNLILAVAVGLAWGFLFGMHLMRVKFVKPFQKLLNEAMEGWIKTIEIAKEIAEQNEKLKLNQK